MLNSCNAIWWRCLFLFPLMTFLYLALIGCILFLFYFLFCNILHFASFPTFLFLPNLPYPTFPFPSLFSPFRPYLPLSVPIFPFPSFLFYLLFLFLLFPSWFIAKLWIWIRWICEILDPDPRIRIQGAKYQPKTAKKKNVLSVTRKREKNSWLLFDNPALLKKISKS